MSYSDDETYSVDKKKQEPLIDDNMKSQTKLSYGKIFLICAANLINSFGSVINNSTITPIMNDIIKFESYQSQIIWYFGPISGLVVQPIIGVISDTLRFSWGRRRIFILVGTLLMMISYAVIFSMLFYELPPVPRKILFAIMYLIVYVATNTMQGCARFIVGDVVPESQQMIANTFIVYISAFSSIFGNLMGGFGVGSSIGKKYNTSMDDTKFMFILGLIFMFIGCFLTCTFVKEVPYRGQAKRKNPFTELWYALKHIPRPVLIISCVVAMSWMTYWPVCINLSSYMINDVFLGNNLGTYDEGLRWNMITQACNAIVQILFGFALNPLIKCIGMKWAYFSSQVLAFACLIPANWITSSKWACLIIFSLIGVSTTCYSSIPYALIGQLLPPSQVGTYMGLMNIFLVCGQLISSIFICTLIGGKVFPNQYRQIFSISSGVAVLSAISCLFIKDAAESQQVFNEDDSDTSSQDRPEAL